MKMWHLLILAVLLLSACSSNNGSTSSTLSGQGATTLANGAVATTQQGANMQQGSDASTELLNTMKMKANLQWKAVYDVAVAGKSYEMTQYVKGVKKFRTDMSVPGVDSKPFESRTYMVDSVFTTCTNPNDKWTCYQVNTPQQQDTDKLIQSNPADYAIVADGTMDVAGTTANCYKITGIKIQGTFRYCYGNEGVPLYVKVQTAETTTEMIAKSFSMGVSDSDFELPAVATQMTLPTMPS